MSQLISAAQISHSFSGRVLFNQLNLGIEDNDRIGLVGPNGVGKSTLLKILTKKITPDSGQVIWRKGLQVGYLAQDPLLNEENTIIETLLSPEAQESEDWILAYELISKIGLDQFDENQKVKNLSGGWKKRLALAKELMGRPHLLFLDEPTNHLDLEGILWLEEFINSTDIAIVTITHDRLFLQRICKKIFDLDPRNANFLWVFTGTYDQYCESKDILIQGQLQREKTLRNTLRRETEWLRRGAQARQTKQKARIERAGVLDQDVQALYEKNNKGETQISFGDLERTRQKLIEIENLGKSYGDETDYLFRHLDLIISGKARIGLLGKNGSGKSTLIKMLLELETPTEGRVIKSYDFNISYFEQQRDTLNQEASVLKNICPEGDYVHFQDQYIHVRSYLEKFLFRGNQIEQPVSRLSGGEQARLRIAQLMLQKSQMLILDEPTNDLDLETLQVLSQALQDYAGAVVLVTHDRYFMDEVCDQIISFSPFAKGSKPILFTGYFQWEEWYLNEKERILEESQKTKNKIKEAEIKVTVSSDKKSQKSQKELAKIQKQIEELEKKQQDLSNQLQLKDILSSPLKLNEISEELNKVNKKLETLLMKWEELETLNS